MARRHRRRRPTCRHSHPEAPPRFACRLEAPRRRRDPDRTSRASRMRDPSDAALDEVLADQVDGTFERCRSITISMTSPSRSLPIGPPASASGET